MKNKDKFRVTYEIWDDESLEAGETDEKGFVTRHDDYLAVEDITPENEADIDLTFSEALELCGGLRASYDPNSVSFVNGVRDYSGVRWFNNDTYHESNRTGKTEQRSLHLPETLTPSARQRIAALLGCK